ncbi:MAG TPA: ATP-binding protein, partial [Candidatus Acidoferrales bacterium]|nr:ATP-binding protein [Candidatus Acidoferrales bacterium]
VDGKFEIRLADNGHGFDPCREPPVGGKNGSAPGPARRGNGLLNMVQRLQSVGGEARIESRLGTGTTITFRLSIKSKPKEA